MSKGARSKELLRQHVLCSRRAAEAKLFGCEREAQVWRSAKEMLPRIGAGVGGQSREAGAVQIHKRDHLLMHSVERCAALAQREDDDAAAVARPPKPERQCKRFARPRCLLAKQRTSVHHQLRHCRMPRRC